MTQTQPLHEHLEHSKSYTMVSSDANNVYFEGGYWATKDDYERINRKYYKCNMGLRVDDKNKRIIPFYF